MLIQASPIELASQALKKIGSSGLIDPNGPKSSKKELLQALLNSSGLGLEEIVFNLKMIASGGDKEETRLRANELLLKLHDVLKEEKVEQAPQINIQVNGENVNFGFLQPVGVQ